VLNNGGLIYVSSSIEGISILNSGFEDIIIEDNCNGGIIYVGSGKSFVIIGCSFEEIRSANNGGVIYVNSCMSLVSISLSEFRNTYSSNDGGAIFFGELISFNISSSSFYFCSAGRYGGAIASASTLEGNRYFINDIFEENVAFSEINGGNDYCDVSSSSSSISFYNITSISAVTSISQSPAFYYLSINTSLDCLLNRSCERFVVFVSSQGADTYYCGSINFPCKTLEFSINNVLSNGGQIIVDEGNYTKSNNILEKDVNIFGNVNSNDESLYPIILSNSSTGGTLFNGNDHYLQFSYLRFLCSSTSPLGNTFFSTCFFCFLFLFFFLCY
jgi:hypothetical protein